MMLDICTIGHLSMDKVVTPQSTKHMPGGTSFYFSKALLNSTISYKLITALSPKDYRIVNELQASGIDVHALPSPHTVYFENSYSADQDHRDQQVLQKAAPFSSAQMPDVTARVFHLGPLLADDIPVKLLEDLSRKGLVSLDVQGYLRHVVDRKVVYRDWADKKRILPRVSILKANEFEMEVLTGRNDAYESARYLADLGVREVIITLGSKGSLIFTKGLFYHIPAFAPTAVVDATGCGDTYMAGYLSKRVKGASVEEAGEYGAAMATLKISSFGPYTGHPDRVAELLRQSV